MLHAVFIIFLFILGACIGSFLNVVVWRLPRIEVPEGCGLWGSLQRTIRGLSYPPSHCPKCDHPLVWRDNLPVIGWLMLRGRCRYCREPISPRYPIIEFITGGLLVFYYVMFFMLHTGPCVLRVDLMGSTFVTSRLYLDSIVTQWPVYGLMMFMICGLLAASLIDAELFIIPLEIPWLMAAVGFVVHAIIDHPLLPGALNVSGHGLSGAMAAGGAAGLLLSLLLFALGKMPQSFPNGEPALEVDKDLFEQEVKRAKAEGRQPPTLPPVYTRGQIRAEMAKEMLFLLPALVGAMLAAVLVMQVEPVGRVWRDWMQYHWLSGLLGSIFGALIGGLVVWLARIFGTLAFGRIAMGLGDVHLMFGVGAIVGAGAATIAFFLAPFAGLAIGLWMLITRQRRELPYGPYLSLATAFVLLAYCPIAAYLAPGLIGLGQMLRNVVGG